LKRYLSMGVVAVGLIGLGVMAIRWRQKQGKAKKKNG
jgi:hypothetical protein